MTVFDWCVIAFLPVAAGLILIEFILNDWSFDFMWEGEEE